MKFLYNFYVFIIIPLTKMVSVVLGEVSFDDMELAHLSHQLNPMECLKLLEAIYLKRPMTDEEYAQSVTKLSLDDESILRRQLDMPFFNRDNCRNKLAEWSRNLPQKSSKWARFAMETALGALGRPDLAKYIKRNERLDRYSNEISRISRNTAIPATAVPQMVSKNIHVSSNKIFKNPPKEAVIQYNIEEANSPSDKNSDFASREIMGAHLGAIRKSNDEDSATRWTAFLILLVVIALTILATVIFALYKKSRGNIFNRTEKCSGDRCLLAERYNPRKSSDTDVDVEQGETSSRCERTRVGRSSTQEQSPRSPSSNCVREETPSTRKPKQSVNKCLNKSQREGIVVEKRAKRVGCAKRCTGMNDRVIKIDKSTKTRERKISERSNQSENPQKPARTELKKFHERIASILRKDPACKCCRCIVYSGNDKSESTKCASTRNKNICMDEQCEKMRLKSIAELCLSPASEDTSPTEELEPKKTKNKERKKKKKKRKKRRMSKAEKDGDKDTAEKEKESDKSYWPENSGRSRDRMSRESRMNKKKPAKATKERYNVEEACTRKTCDMVRSNTDAISNYDKNL